jgi:acyl-CoA thioesterase FadM
MQGEIWTTGIDVEPPWIDYSGHMNNAYFLIPFEMAVVDLAEIFDLSRAYRERTDRALFTVQSQITHLQEVVLGDRLSVATRLLDASDKAIHVYCRMFKTSSDSEVALFETVLLHVDLRQRRTVRFAAATGELLAKVAEIHRRLVPEPKIGQKIGLRR